MAENKLPNGVGKKIVQALKKQAEIEIKAVPEQVSDTDDFFARQTAEAFESNISDDISLDEGFSDFSGQNGFFSEPEPISLNNFEPSAIDVEEPFDTTEDYSFDSNDNLNYAQADTYVQPQVSRPAPQQPQNHSMPSNVAVLKRLISQLPGGVTKQTGAQIIRQTMEALGISMNSVLKEAQQVQDSLNDSARTCMTSIQEYKNNIRSLEKQVQDYKKQAVSLNDLISLFVLTDKRGS